MKMPHILFFIAGMSPTNAEAEAALEIGVVAYRNANVIGKDDRAEKCDAVAGDPAIIPAPYADKPVVKTLSAAVAIMREKQKAANVAATRQLAEQPSPEAFAAEGEKGKEASAPGGSGGKSNAPAGKGAAAPGWKANA